MNGNKKTQRNSVSPQPIGPPFIRGAGNQFGGAKPKRRKVLAIAKATNTETMPFQKSPNNRTPKAVPNERCVAPITVSAPSARYHVPTGGLLTSTDCSISPP